MFIAGEASGDGLAAELVQALRVALLRLESRLSKDVQPLYTSLEPQFFGAGGRRMAEAGVALAFDMTSHAVVGLVEVLKNYAKFKRLFNQLLQLAIVRQPDAIILVDFSGFNRRFAHAIKQYVRARRGSFNNWDPKLIQYVSPQVWASRESRVHQLARDLDLLLTIFPFEKEWYALRAPTLRVEFVGHPLCDRFKDVSRPLSDSAPNNPGAPQLVLLLPGSRAGELRRHLPVMIEAARRMETSRSLEFRMVLPAETLVEQARSFVPAKFNIQIGHLADSLRQADLAIASTGTVTMECAYFGVPTVALYKTSWSTYQIGKHLIRVNFLAMPNLLAGEPIYPEFIQHAATAENIAHAAIDLLDNTARRSAIKAKLAKVIASLGGPGANQRATRAIMQLLYPKTWTFPAGQSGTT
jgi:lipid-A-disaccharide synthase